MSTKFIRPYVYFFNDSTEDVENDERNNELDKAYCNLALIYWKNLQLQERQNKTYKTN